MYDHATETEYDDCSTTVTTQVAGEEMGAHLFGVGGEGELNIFLERVAEDVQQFVLETDGGATVEKVIGRVAEQQHVKGVGAVLHIDHLLFREGGIDRLGAT